MKRLIKKSDRNDAFVSPEPTFVPMGELDEADVKNDRCPACKTQKPLQKEDGFKRCLSCGKTYKMFDGDGYSVIN